MDNKTDRPKILIVDDTPENIEVLDGILRDEYDICVAINGVTAQSVAEKQKPDLILLDVMMPVVDGFECCRRLKANYWTRKIPIIFITAKTSFDDQTTGFESGGVDYVTKPFNPAVVKARVKTHIALHNRYSILTKLVSDRTEELNLTRLQIIQRLGRAAEYKDNETGLHVIRMSHYARLLCLALGMNEEDADLIFQAAPLHDIGKLGIPDYILQKPGKLTDDEWETMKKHPQYGAEIIGDDDDTDLFRIARSIALTHHEKWDGSGYPNGLSGSSIPIEGRVTAIADVFDALTSERPYKKAWSVDKAVDHILNQSGKHFDPELVEKFEKVLPDFVAIRDNHLENNSHWEQKKRYWAATYATEGFANLTSMPTSMPTMDTGN